ncbi:AAA family ATPase [Methylocystis sp. H4A]|uniref:AAA family ATPase n=1 Tax=Methylocystis sp. H4A TaxID=2785788 RepID=UPI0018C3102D|nr:AAA family ATPase [Methylocystis sp. H4A]MBG0801267.1 AAA family ATPase [Methylocystis sp. H4A]
MAHKVRAINAPADNGGKIAPIKITNEEFLKALAGADWQRVPISWGENSWWVSPAGKNIGKPTIESSNYFTVSIFALAADGKFRRTKELFIRQFVFVIDDVGTKLSEAEVRAVMPPATYELETSPGNWQYGYRLTNGTDARALDALICAIVDDPDINPSLKDPGMKGVTRVARLPVGSNNKDNWKDEDGKGWPHRMAVWNPEIAYSVEDLAFWLGVDLSEESLAKFKDVSGARRATSEELGADPILKLFDMKEMLLDATPNDNGFVSVVCPWAAEHSDSRNEAGYRPGSGGFQCHHGHCESRNMNDLRAWVAEHVTPAEQAQALAETFAASPVDENALNAELIRIEDYRIKAQERAEARITEALGAPPSARDELRLSSWLKRDLPPRDFLSGDVLSTTSRLLLIGPTGIGKTLFSLAWAAAIAGGADFLGWQGRRAARVAYLDGEMSADLFKERSEIVAGLYGEGIELFGYNRDILGPNEMAPLNSDLGRAWLWREIDIVKPDVIFFDNIMSLLAGAMGDEEAWGQIKDLTLQISARRIAQVWMHHTGHDASKGFGTKTREWQMESVIMLSKLDGAEEETCAAQFRLEFTKARTRSPANYRQFAPWIVRSDEDAGFVAEGAPTASKGKASSELDFVRRGFLAAYEELAGAAAFLRGPDNSPARRKVSIAALRDKLKNRGVLDKNETGQLSATGRSHFRRVKSQLLDKGGFAEDQDLIWKIPQTPS